MRDEVEHQHIHLHAPRPSRLRRARAAGTPPLPERAASRCGEAERCSILEAHAPRTLPRMSDAPPIALKNVSKAFRGKPAVIDLTLTVPAGGIFGLLGHNGAGKSTTLGMLLGQVLPDRGSVRLHGHDVFAERAAALAPVGAIFESPCFYDYLSGRRNLRALTAFSGGVPRALLNDTVARVGLTGRIDDRVGTYSHGMRQRLALAQALLPEPRTLILDEPTDGLDPEGIAELRDNLRTLNRELGLTILFSSHLLSEVENLCDHIAVMKAGRLIYTGDWKNERPATPRVKVSTDRPLEALLAARASGVLADGAISNDQRDQPWPLADTATPADLNRILVTAGFAVHELTLVRPTLEDFYLAAESPQLPSEPL